MKKLFLNLILILFLFLTSCSKNKNYEFILFRETKDDSWSIMKNDGSVITKNEWDYKTFEPIVLTEGKVLFRKNVDGKSKFEFYTVEEKPTQIGKSYVSASPFSEGLAGVTEENGRIQFINDKMEVEFSLNDVDGLEIEKAFPFKNGFAKIMNEKNEFGFINKEGVAEIKPKYSFVSTFSSNSFALCVKSPNQKIISEINSIIQDALRDSIELTYSMDNTNTVDAKKINDILNENRRRLKEQNLYVLNIIDKEGKVVFEKKWYQDESFIVNGEIFSNKGYFSFTDNSDNNWGIMNFKGDKIVKPNSKYKGFTQIINNYAVYISEENKYGVIDLDKDGEIIIRAKYDKLTLSDEGDKIFVRTDKKVTVKDLEDNDILKDEYDAILPIYFKNYLVKEGDKWAFVDEDGKNINKDDYYDLDILSEDEIYNISVETDFFDASKTIQKLTELISESKYLEFDFNGVDAASIANRYKIEMPLERYYAYGQNIGEFYKDKNFKASVDISYIDPIIEPNMTIVSYGGYNVEQQNGWKYVTQKSKINSFALSINYLNSKAGQKTQEVINKILSAFEAKGFKKISDSNYESNMLNVSFDGRNVIRIVNKTSYNNMGYYNSDLEQEQIRLADSIAASDAARRSYYGY